MKTASITEAKNNPECADRQPQGRRRRRKTIPACARRHYPAAPCRGAAVIAQQPTPAPTQACRLPMRSSKSAGKDGEILGCLGDRAALGRRARDAVLATARGARCRDAGVVGIGIWNASRRSPASRCRRARCEGNCTCLRAAQAARGWMARNRTRRDRPGERNAISSRSSVGGGRRTSVVGMQSAVLVTRIPG